MTKRMILIGVLVVLAATEASASMGGGSSRIPMTDFIVELYNVTNNVYVPMIAFGALVFGAANLLFGFMRFGPAIGRIFGVIGILGLGVFSAARGLGHGIDAVRAGADGRAK